MQARDSAPGGDRWSIWIDTGGTFTDCVARDPAGRVHRAKVLSSGALRSRVVERPAAERLRIAPPGELPADFFAGWRLRPLAEAEAGAEIRRSSGDGSLELETAPGEINENSEISELGELGEGDDVELVSPEEAAVVAARLVTRTPPGSELPPLELRLATTRGTNALLERKGAATALFVTRGFADLLAIGNQQRPELFAVDIRKPAALYERVVEVDERLTADGSVLRPPALAELAEAARRLAAAGIRVAAVALLHSYRNPEHERRVGALLADCGFEHVSLSSELAPLIRYVPRAETAVVDAYLAPVIGGYVDGVRRALGLTSAPSSDVDTSADESGGAPASGAARLRVMTSAGGLVRAESFRAKDSLLSGPAGGVVGAAAAGRRSGRERLVAFDMGGTSTDVSRYDGEFDYRFETRVAAARLMAPALAIETVAAGGGSICRLDGRRLRVGPESAGARPGPACYGAGGPLTLTDVNLLLGRLEPSRFGIPLDPGAARSAAAGILEAVRRAGDPGMELERLLSGFLRIADERMAGAIRRISIREGYRPSDYALVAFGGAGAQHACSLAALLGVGTVLVPADAGLLSAWGLGAAVVERFAERQVLAELDEVGPRLDAWMRELGEEAAAALAEEGVPDDEVVVRLQRLHLRLAGQDTTLAVDHEPGRSPADAFEVAYRDHYGYRPEARPIEVESLRVVASSRPAAGTVAGAPAEGREATPESRREAWLGGGWRRVACFDRAGLEAGDRLHGPALVFESHSATVVDNGWSGAVDSAGALVLRRGDGTGEGR